MFGLQSSDYYNASRPATDKQRGKEDLESFNQILNWERSATNNFFTGKIDGELFAPQRVDYGSIYASMIFRTDDRRQVMFLWIVESAAGCTGMCSDELPEVIKRQGFKGAQTMPRQITYDPITKTMRGYPVREMATLRGKQVRLG